MPTFLWVPMLVMFAAFLLHQARHIYRFQLDESDIETTPFLYKCQEFSLQLLSSGLVFLILLSIVKFCYTDFVRTNAIISFNNELSNISSRSTETKSLVSVYSDCMDNSVAMNDVAKCLRLAREFGIEFDLPNTMQTINEIYLLEINAEHQAKRR